MENAKVNVISELRVPAHESVRPPCPVIDMHTHFGALLMGEDYESLYDTREVADSLRRAGVVRALSVELAWDMEYDKLQKKVAASDGLVMAVGSIDISKALDKDFEALAYKQAASLKQKGCKAVKLWKNMTLHAQQNYGRAVALDDPCFAPVWAACAEAGLPIIIHIADPPCFFRPNDPTNEHFRCLTMHPEWSFYRPGIPGFEEHMRMQEAVIGQNPKTTFIVAHMGSYAENLGQVGEWLDRFPNMYVDTSARLDQLGRQPFTARRFMIQYADRVLFGTDYEARMDPQRTAEFYNTHYRFFQTEDEYFDHPFSDFLGEWKIYGINLPGDVLQKLYHDNAARVLDIQV